MEQATILKRRNVTQTNRYIKENLKIGRLHPGNASSFFKTIVFVLQPQNTIVWNASQTLHNRSECILLQNTIDLVTWVEMVTASRLLNTSYFSFLILFRRLYFPYKKDTGKQQVFLLNSMVSLCCSSVTLSRR